MLQVPAAYAFRGALAGSKTGANGSAVLPVEVFSVDVSVVEVLPAGVVAVEVSPVGGFSDEADGVPD
ncbi:MAG: hypothetical protein NTX94_01415 [Caldiserica bacterium]|nr:hypothetical protein [Caldisericota bacterium]